MTTQKIAVYWDFENLHVSLFTRQYDEEYKPFQPQREKLVNIPVLMDYMLSLGDVVINRAYNNWQFFAIYKTDLLVYAIDLVQLYPKGSHAKNGADIRLALDVLEDTYHHSHITHVVIVGGDSDYIAVAQKLKKIGKFVIGIGVQGSTNPYWTRSCNEFKYYDTLMLKASQEEEQIQDTEEKLQASQSIGNNLTAAKELLVKAVQRLMSEDDVDDVLKAKVRPMMTRLNPGFDPGNYSFKTFNAFLEACNDVIYSYKGEFDIMISLKKKDRPSKINKSSTDTILPKKLPADNTKLNIPDNNGAIDRLLWALRANLLGGENTVTLSDIGVTIKLFDPNFDMQTYNYTKSRGLKGVAEDADARGLIRLDWNELSGLHTVYPTENFDHQLNTLQVPDNLYRIRCIRMASKLHMMFRMEDIIKLFEVTRNVYQEFRLRNETLTMANLADICYLRLTNEGKNSKKWNVRMCQLLKTKAFKDTDGLPICEINETNVSTIDDLGDIGLQYLYAVQREIQSVFKEDVDIDLLRSVYEYPD